MTAPILLQSHPFADLLPPMSRAEYEELRDSIRANGQREPITLHRDGRILEGRHRYRACAEVGVQPRYRTFEGTDSEALAFVLDMNVKRRHLDASQRAAIAAEVANMRHGGDRRSDQAAILPLVSQANAAAMLNVSERSVRDAVAVRASAPVVFAAVKVGQIPVSRAVNVARMPPARQDDVLDRIGRGESVTHVVLSATRAEKAQQIDRASLNIPLPSLGRLFPVLYADPPWLVESYTPAGMGRAADLHYQCRPLDEICALPVADIAARDSVLFMWALPNMWPEALEVVKAWGFEFCASAVWVKPHITLGHWFRNQHEHIICAKRGNMPPPPHIRSSVFTGPSAVPGEHSSKPNEVRDWIASAYPDVGRVELFARTAAPGWHAWGNQAPAAVP